MITLISEKDDTIERISKELSEYVQKVSNLEKHHQKTIRDNELSIKHCEEKLAGLKIELSSKELITENCFKREEAGRKQVMNLEYTIDGKNQ